MDIDDVKDIGNNLPDKKITPPSTDMVPGDGTGASKKLDDLTPKNQGRSTGHEGTDVSDLQGNDVLDPEGEDVLDPENDGNNLNKDKKDPKEENADSSGETEDILDPEAEKEKGDKQDKKDDKKDDSNDSEDGKGDSSGDGGTDSSNVDGGSGDSSSSGSGTDSGFGSNGNGGSDLGSGSSSSGSSGLSGTDTGLGSGGSTPELGTGGGSNLGGQVGNNALANGTGNAANLANGASNTANIANGANMANGAMQGGSAAAMQGGGAAAMQGGGSAAAGSSSAGIFANPYVLLAIVIIIVIIGLIGFILNMPGLLVGKIKQFAQDLWDGLQSMFENEAQAFINDDDVTKLAQYLTDMDYDLISYGFVRANIEDDYETFLDLEEQGYYLRESGRYSKIDSNGNETFYNGYYYSASGDLVNNETAELVVKDERFTKDKYGIRYWAADGNHRSNSGDESHTKGQIAEIYDGDRGIENWTGLETGATADDSLLRSYLMADYRVTVLRNDDEGLLNNLGKYLDQTFGGAPNAWSKGMIKVFRRNGTNVESLVWTEGILTGWWNNVTIKDGTKLSLKHGWFNRPMEFELDGWTGRYGLSLEFLLSLHLGTMAPDLVTAMLQCFDTEVQVYIEAIEDAQVTTKYKDYTVDDLEEELDDNNEEVTLEDLNNIIESSDEDYWLSILDGALIEWVNELSLTKKKCQEILLKSGLSSPENCIYTAVDYVILHMQSHYGEGSFWDTKQTCNYLKEDFGVSDPDLEEFEYRVKEDTNRYYTADNSLYSVREDFEIGSDTDPNAEVVKTGLDSHVYPDRQTAYDVAISYGMKAENVESSIDSNFTKGAANPTNDNKEVIGPDNFVYRIEKDMQNAEWQMYGYLDGTEFKLVDEETFNNDTQNKYEETTAYYHSYIYKIYQIGILDDGNVSYFRDNKENDKGTFVNQFKYDEGKIVSIYYDKNAEATSFVYRLKFYDENGEEITGLQHVATRAGVYYYINVHNIPINGASNIYKLTIRTYDDNVSFKLTHEISARGYNNVTDIAEQVHAISEITNEENNSAITGDILYDVLYMNFAIRDKSMEELVQCGLLEKTADGEYVPVDESATRCSADKELTKCCTICQRYVKGVIRALAQVQDMDYSYFQPYIARVVGSWFRDTYFIIPENEDGGLKDYYGSGKAPVGSYGSNGRYVKVDEEYLASSGEYWTDYEMKIDPETGLETDAYQLYYLNPDGTTSDKKMEDWLTEEHVSNLTGETKIFTSKEEAERDGYVFVKRAKLMSLSDVKDVASGEGGGRDLEEKPYMEGTLWSAYTYGSGEDTGWIKINRGEVDNVDLVYDMVDDKGEFYYRLVSTKSIEQEEDAIRTETNVTVKNLFRYRQYYIFDGTTGRAEAIQADRLKVFDLITAFFADSSNRYSKSTAMLKVKSNGRYASRLLYNYDTIASSVEDNQIAESWLEWQLDMYYRADNENAMSDAEKELFKLDELCEYGINKTYVNEKGETVTYLDKEYYTSENHSLDPRDRNLISTVNITKSSLDAFAILENVNTLDADYQYRDFKELIVELNYFDKEDLSETIEEVFTWLVPTYTSNWPILGIDKQNNEYGTLVHSQESIDFLIKVYEKLVEKERALAETNGTTDDTVDLDNTTEDEEFDMSKVYYIGDSWFVGLKNGGYTESSNDYFTAHVGKKAGDPEYNNIQVKSDASAIVIMLGLNGATTQTQMKALLEDLSSRYDDKNIYVLKVFHVGRNYTVMNKDTLNSLIDTYNDDIKAFCATKDNLKFVDATDGILDSEGYIDPSIESADGMHLTSYGTLYNNIEKAVKAGEGNTAAQTENEKILELLKEAEAYQEGDSVISPVTGKIIAYGEHERINVYTEEKEKVGYVKIEVMSYGEDHTDANKSYFTLGMMPSELTQEEKEEAVLGLNSFYKEYRNQCAGYILTIDGIDITDLKNGFTSLTNAEGEEVEYEDLCEYETEEVTALYNSKEQKAKEAEAKAKTNAPSFIKYNANYNEVSGEYFAQDSLGGYYVKEGAYLGTVQAATTRTGEKAEVNAGMQNGSNPNIANPEDLVDEDTERVTDIRVIYEEFLDPTKNPNYIRMIMLDEEKTVVDNIEDYFPGPEYENSMGSAYQGSWSEKGLYWMIVGFEGMQMSEVTNGFVAIEVIGNDGKSDGTVTAGGSGITNWCNEVFWQLGYEEYMHYKRGSNVGMEVGDVIPGNVIMDVKAVVLETHITNVEKAFPDNNFTQEQVEALASVSYNFGHIPTSLVNAINSNSNIKEVWEHLSDSQASQYPGLVPRRKAEYKLFSEGIYSNSSGELVFQTDTPYTDYINGNNTVTYKK